MAKLPLLLAALIGVIYISQDRVSGLEVELTVRPGDNITLYCDRRKSPGASIVWFRNCSHKNQPTLEINVLDSTFNLKYNTSTESTDLLIKEISDSNLGLYYCGTKDWSAEEGCIKASYKYGNITTRILFNHSRDSEDSKVPDGSVSCDCDCDSGMSWLLLILSRVMLLFLLPSAYYIGTICGSNRIRRELQRRAN